ncbi:MAG: competence/damage-inducible protein A [Eubacteriales bacterium]
MRAELISTGTELLLGQILNTNAQFLGQRLAQLGLDVYFQTTVGDNGARLAEVFNAALKRADLIIVTGGLGPTEDDLTKETIAETLELEMFLDEESLTHVQEFFKLRGRKMPETNKKQAQFPEGAAIIPNKMGTAPGVIIEAAGRIIIILPGPPVEMQPMFNETVVPFLKKKIGRNNSVIHSKVLKILGMGESTVEERIKDLVDEQTNPTIAFLAPRGEVFVRITAKAKTEAAADKMINKIEKEIRKRLGDYIYGADDDSLEKVVAGLLKKHGLTISTAESCTGGMIAQRLTNIPGVSDNFMYGVVSYSNEAKTGLLGVPPEIIEKHGAVSEETAIEMVKGVRQSCGTDLAVSVTGIAGPSGGTPEKPVGLVYIGFSDRDTTIVQRFLFTGDREVIRWQTANAALNMLRRYLIKYKR